MFFLTGTSRPTPSSELMNGSSKSGKEKSLIKKNTNGTVTKPSDSAAILVNMMKYGQLSSGTTKRNVVKRVSKEQSIISQGSSANDSLSLENDKYKNFKGAHKVDYVTSIAPPPPPSSSMDAGRELQVKCFLFAI